MLDQDDMFHNNDIIAADITEIKADKSSSVNAVFLFLFLLSFCILYMK
jgi:hypothetical protein